MRLPPVGICEIPTIPQSLRQRISQGAANVDVSQLQSTWREFEYRVNVCIVTNEARIEYLFTKFMSFYAVFNLFHMCISKDFEITLISYNPDYL
jgi:hypothetical protein